MRAPGPCHRSRHHHRLAAGISPIVESLESRTMLSVNLVKDINPTTTTGDAVPSDLVDVNGTLFIAVAGQLWKSDGTAGGTVQVAPGQLNPGSMTNLAGTLYFFSNGSLWKSDGTSGGTVQV